MLRYTKSIGKAKEEAGLPPIRCTKTKAPGGIRRGEKTRGPWESPQSGTFWEKEGMTERYEKSPIGTDRAF